MLMTFQSYPASAQAVFDCPSCGKKNRKRTFKHECTVNPFNKNDDGSVKEPAQVRKQSFDMAEAERTQFMKEPLCSTCENALSYSEIKELRARRRAP